MLAVQRRGGRRRARACRRRRSAWSSCDSGRPPDGRSSATRSSASTCGWSNMSSIGRTAAQGTRSPNSSSHSSAVLGGERGAHFRHQHRRHARRALAHRSRSAGRWPAPARPISSHIAAKEMVGVHRDIEHALLGRMDAGEPAGAGIAHRRRGPRCRPRQSDRPGSSTRCATATGSDIAPCRCARDGTARRRRHRRAAPR